jgi:hypothetical protein
MTCRAILIGPSLNLIGPEEISGTRFLGERVHSYPCILNAQAFRHANLPIQRGVGGLRAPREADWRGACSRFCHEIQLDHCLSDLSR